MKALLVSRRSLLVMTTLLLANISSVKVLAQELDCLRGLEGRVVRWDADWQRDRSDMDVRYTIRSVTDQNAEGGIREIVVALEAADPARLPERTARIRLDHAALMFCGRVIPLETARLVRLPTDPRSIVEEKPKPVDTVDPRTLSFRVLVHAAWLPARPKDGETLNVCKTAHDLFACNTEDFKAWSKSDTPESNVFLLKTTLPFIRHTSSGWVRSDPVSSNPEETLAECRVLNRQFSCLTREKHLYEPELRILEHNLLTAAND